MLSDTNKIRATNTIRLAVVAVVVVISSFYFKVPGNILALKLLVIPMFWLSLLGLRALYKNPIEEQAVFSANVIEYNALYIFLFSVFLLIVFWTPALELSAVLKGAIFVYGVGLPLSLLLHHRDQNRSPA